MRRDHATLTEPTLSQENGLIARNGAPSPSGAVLGAMD